MAYFMDYKLLFLDRIYDLMNPAKTVFVQISLNRNQSSKNVSTLVNKTPAEQRDIFRPKLLQLHKCEAQE